MRTSTKRTPCAAKSTVASRAGQVIKEILEFTPEEQLFVLTAISEGIADMAMNRRKYAEGEVTHENEIVQKLVSIIGEQAVESSYKRVYGDPGCEPCKEKRSQV